MAEAFSGELALFKKKDKGAYMGVGLAAFADNSGDIEYGTPEMANEIIRFIKEPLFTEQKIIAMAGHEEGILCFGKTAKETGEIITDWLNRL